MFFKDVIGQADMKARLWQMLREERVPHALLFAGPEGSGKLAMALAFASRLLCKSPGVEESCGHCQACHQSARLIHPDLHFVFPVIRPAGKSGAAVSDMFLPQWREQIATTPYFSRQTWLARMGVENQQSFIGVAEANSLITKLFTVSSQGGYRVVIVWLAEQMNEETANKLLKILEEPPAGTVFILTTNHPEKMLATILSRTQRIDFKPIPSEEMADALMQRHGLQADDALAVARSAAGSYVKALEEVTNASDAACFFDQFVLLMRLCYMRKVKDLFEWSVQLSQWGRERQKAFLEYAQRMVRENFIYNFGRRELNFQNKKEADFSVRFARFINERNVMGIAAEISSAQRDIEQNVNPRMVFFDFALKMIMLLIR